MVLFLCCLLVVLLYGLHRRFLWRYCWLLCFMDCIVDFDGDIVNCFVFWLYHRGGIWFLGYLVSVSVLYGCKFYCIILLYQTLFYLFFWGRCFFQELGLVSWEFNNFSLKSHGKMAKTQDPCTKTASLESFPKGKGWSDGWLLVTLRHFSWWLEWWFWPMRWGESVNAGWFGLWWDTTKRV